MDDDKALVHILGGRGLKRRGGAKRKALASAAPKNRGNSHDFPTRSILGNLEITTMSQRASCSLKDVCLQRRVKRKTVGGQEKLYYSGHALPADPIPTANGPVCSEYCQRKWLVNEGILKRGLSGMNMLLLMGSIFAVLMYTLGDYEKATSLTEFKKVMGFVTPVSHVFNPLHSNDAVSINYGANHGLIETCCVCKLGLGFVCKQVSEIVVSVSIASIIMRVSVSNGMIVYVF